MKYDATYLGENFGEKLNIAINQKYKDLPERKRKAQFKKDFCTNQETTREEKPFNNTFHKWIYGGIVPDTVTLIKICNFFNCEMDYFLTEQETFSKSIESAADVTGLEYQSVEVLSQAKQATAPDTETYTDSKLLFVLNFILKSNRCHQLFNYLYYYWFKDYYFVSEYGGSATTDITLEDESGIEERNIGIHVSDISTTVFYSYIMQAITRIKDLEAVNIDLTAAEYTPTKADIENEIAKIDAEIKIEEVRDYSKFFPYDIRKGLQAACTDGISFGRLDPEPDEEQKYISEYGEMLSEEVSKRYAIDYERDQTIENLQHRKERLKYKLQKLYPDSKG
jgi:hypothetical protein